jgi:NADPH:quinone reductase
VSRAVRFDACGDVDTLYLKRAELPFARREVALADLAELVANVKLTVPIAATYPLDDVRAAYTELANGRTRGKTVLIR